MTDSEVVVLGTCPICEKPVVRDPAAAWMTDGSVRSWTDDGRPIHWSCMLKKQTFSFDDILAFVKSLQEATGTRPPVGPPPAEWIATQMLHSMYAEMIKYPEGHGNGDWTWWVENTCPSRRDARLLVEELSRRLDDALVGRRGKTVRLTMAKSSG